MSKIKGNFNRKKLINFYLNLNFLFPGIFITLLSLGIGFIFYLGNFYSNPIYLFFGLLFCIIIVWSLESNYKISVQNYKKDIENFKNNIDSNLNTYPRNEIIILIISTEFIACILLIYGFFIKPFLR